MYKIIGYYICEKISVPGFSGIKSDILGWDLSGFLAESGEC